MINRYLIRYFLAVVDQGNFSRAAVQCRVSQPTLSVGIAKLELLLGQPVFNRTNRRVELTRVGARFAVHARRIEAGFIEAEREAQADAPSGLLRIGIVSTLPADWIGHAVAAARTVTGGERLELVEGRMRDLGSLLDRGRVDVVLGIVQEDDTPATRLFSEGYAIALPASHPLAASETLRVDEIASETMMVRRHCEALPVISRFFTSRGVRPFMAARTTNDDRAVAYVRAGLGVTVMPRCFLQAGIAMPLLAGFDTRRTIGLRVTSADAHLLRDSETLARFGTAIQQCVIEPTTCREPPDSQPDSVVSSESRSG